MGRHVPWDRSPEPILPGLLNTLCPSLIQYRLILPASWPQKKYPGTQVLGEPEILGGQEQTLLGRMGTVDALKAPTVFKAQG